MRSASTHICRSSRARRAILKAMKRTYSRERYLRLVDEMRGRDPRPRPVHGRHRRLPGRDRSGLRGDARGRRGSRLRQRVHVRLLASQRHRGGDHARPGAGGRQATAHRAARRPRPARRARPQPGARGTRRAGPRRGPEPHRLLSPARPHSAQHERELHRLGSSGRARRRANRWCDLDDPARHRARPQSQRDPAPARSRLGGSAQRPRPRRPQHGGRLRDAIWPRRPSRQHPPADRRRLAGAARLRDQDDHRPRGRTRSWKPIRLPRCRSRSSTSRCSTRIRSSS